MNVAGASAPRVARSRDARHEVCTPLVGGGGLRAGGRERREYRREKLAPGKSLLLKKVKIGGKHSSPALYACTVRVTRSHIFNSTRPSSTSKQHTSTSSPTSSAVRHFFLWRLPNKAHQIKKPATNRLPSGV